MHRKHILIATVAVPPEISMPLLALATPLVTSDDAIPANAEEKVDNFSFGPQTLTVAVGTEVVWVNRDDIPHTIVSADGIFKSKAHDTEEKFSTSSRNRACVRTSVLLLASSQDDRKDCCKVTQSER